MIHIYLAMHLIHQSALVQYTSFISLRLRNGICEKVYGRSYPFAANKYVSKLVR